MNSGVRSTSRRLADGFLNGGFAWLARTVKNEIRNPRRAPTFACRRIIAKAVTLGYAVQRAMRRDAADSHRRFSETLVFFLDLDASPITFDVASYLAGAEVTRRKLGLEDIFVVIVPGRHAGFRAEDSEYDSIVDIEARSWRVDNIVLPILSLLPNVSGFEVCRSREDAASIVRTTRHIFPDTYVPSMPRQPSERLVRDAARSGQAIWPLFRASPKALQYARKVFDSHGGCPRPVVISLRQYGHMPQRNSDIAVWGAFAKTLKSSGFTPIFVIDMEATVSGQLAGIADEIVLDAAFWNLSLRMAVYELAWLNMAIMHGPMELCWYNEKCRYVVFIPVGAAPQCSPEALREQGHEIGVDFRFSKPYQRLVWEADTLEAVDREFAAIRPIIEELERQAD